MIKKWLMHGAATLTLLTFGSYVMGLLRDRILARTFGASRELDIYNASFIVPDLLLNILVAGTISSAFIPIFTELRTQGHREKAEELANSVLNSAVLSIVIFGGLAAVFMPWLADFIAPKFSPEEKKQLVLLSRLMLISPVLMAASNTLGGMLISFKRFFAYGLSPILYNGGIILGTLLAAQFGILGLTIGTLFGALLHAAPRLIALFRTDFRYRLRIAVRDLNFQKTLKLMLPKMVGHPVEQLTFMAFTRIATGLAAGSVAVIGFARNFQSVAVSLFGISFSIAAFPVLAELAAKGDRANFLKNFWKSFRDIALFSVLSALGFFIFGEFFIRIFLGGGKFSDENILRTGAVLSAFAFSILSESLIHLLARSFYAFKNTVIPVLMSLVGLAVGVSFASLNSETMGITAIPYGFFWGSSSEAVLLGIFLWRRVGRMKPSATLSPPPSPLPPEEYPLNPNRGPHP